MPPPKQFATEAALCSTFIGLIDKRTWVAYAETQGWDILLARKVDGFQIGIQAKLSLNADVINQAIEDAGSWHCQSPGPDCRAVLVPADGSGRLQKICDYVGLIVFTVRSAERYSMPDYQPRLPDRPDCHHRNGWSDWHEWAPKVRHSLPEFVPDVQAGAPAPLKLTDWKIKALKLAVILDNRGYVTRSDFAHLRLDHRRWIANEWLIAGKHGWVAGKAMPPFKKQHPKNYKQVADKFKEWKPPEGLL